MVDVSFWRVNSAVEGLSTELEVSVRKEEEYSKDLMRPCGNLSR